ncbi:MAG: NAD-dependent epimerase/dehydratase family protein [Phycisphaerae bacterium]|nr:NAD-dependent epimerase/dehydratase family protein [Phycisphaerae bacterium]
MVFVMGGRGFVGSAYGRLFARLGIEHEILEIDNYAHYRGRSCDILINANGNSKKFLATQDPLAEFDGTVRPVCQSLHDIKFNKYVLCSTCDVYNEFADPALNHEAVEIDPARQSRYGFHKHIAERFVRYEAKDYLIFRFGGFVGPNMRKNPIFDILNGGPLWLAAESRLQFLHTDVAAATVWNMIQRGIRGETFNLCGNGLVCLQDVMAWAGRSVPVKENSPAVTYHINISKIQQYVDIPSTSETVRQFVEEYVRADK